MSRRPELLDKRALRAIARQRRAAWDAAWVADRSRQIARHVTALPEFAAARVVFCYLTVAGEVETDAIIRAAWQQGKQIFVPAHAREQREYRPAALAPADAVRPGPWGIPEPVEPRWMEAGSGMDLAIVPGLVFDTNGARLGRGGGHYDRLLRNWAGPGCFKVGVAFEAQIMGPLPLEPHDIRMDAVVTERSVYRPAAPGVGMVTSGPGAGREGGGR